MKKVKVWLLLSAGLLLSYANGLAAHPTNHAPATQLFSDHASYADADIRSNLEDSDHILADHYDASVSYFVKDNLYYGRRTFSKVLARTKLYFPIIEKVLEDRGLPQELKHLMIVESHANPLATSHCGAKGLWQLMPQTARRFGLTVNAQQDDRMDPRKSTEAALQYLTYLYNYFNQDWTLAIAAYNCGEGRVKSAIRRTQSADYQRIKHLLPRQTQKYIPAILAAGYSIRHYAQHGVVAAQLPFVLQFTRTVKVFDQLSFTQIASITNTPVSIIEKLNPSYLNGQVPGNQAGNYVILPSVSSGHLSSYLRGTEREVLAMNF